MIVRLRVWAESLRQRLWVIPAISALAAALAAGILVNIDRNLGPDATGPFQFGGGADSARSILSTVAASMLTFTGLVFTVTMLVLQLAASQLSPRVTRTFLRDRKNQAVLGIFVATFVYALLVLREVRSADAFVPSIAVWWAFVLLLSSIGAFVFYIDHMAHAIQASTIIHTVAAETREAIERCLPDRTLAADRAVQTLPNVTATITAPDPSGVVQGVDLGGLEQLAIQRSAVFELVVTVGDAVPSGAPLILVRGGEPIDSEVIRGLVAIGPNRTMDQDPAFGLRQLVDVAVRALSPGTNDPTTAHQVIDQLHDLLRRIAQRPIPGPNHFGAGATLLVIVPRTDWPDYLRLACEEIRTYGAGSAQVIEALRRMLDDIDRVVLDEGRRAEIRRQRDRLPAEVAPVS